METIGQLTGGIAHDFNNLLSIVLGNLEFLEETCPPDSQQATFIGNAVKAALRGAQLIRRLIAFARRQSLAPRLTELAPVLEGSRQLFRSTLVPYGLTRDIFCANWRCGRDIFWHNGPAVMA